MAKGAAGAGGAAGTGTVGPEEAGRRIDARIAELGDWHRRKLARVRALIREAVPDLVEE